MIRYRGPGTFRGLDGRDHPIGWVYAVDLLDYFGVIFDDRHPGWSDTTLANEATLYRSRAEAAEVIERRADRWPAATIVDIDSAPVVDNDVARSLPDAEQAAIVVLEPGTRFIEPSPTARPNGRADQRRQAATGLDDAQRVLAEVNEILDHAGQPSGDVAGAPPLEQAPDTGPDIGL